MTLNTLPDGPYDTAPPVVRPFTQGEKRCVKESRESIRIGNEQVSKLCDRVQKDIGDLLPANWRETRTQLELAFEELDGILWSLEDEMEGCTESDPCEEADAREGE